jgi:hypothetical protein
VPRICCRSGLYWEERVVDWVKRSAGALLAGALAVAWTGATPALADSPFPALIGAWSGKGTARIEGGKNERLSCKGYYSGSGSNQMRLNIICANASTKEERNYNQTGTISGSADGSKLRLKIGGGALNGQLSVSFTGAKQSVSLSTQGSALKGVNISFARNG